MTAPSVRLSCLSIRRARGTLKHASTNLPGRQDRRFRTRAGLTQAALARRLEISAELPELARTRQADADRAPAPEACRGVRGRPNRASRRTTRRASSAARRGAGRHAVRRRSRRTGRGATRTCVGGAGSGAGVPATVPRVPSGARRGAGARGARVRRQREPVWTGVFATAVGGSVRHDPGAGQSLSDARAGGRRPVRTASLESYDLERGLAQHLSAEHGVRVETTTAASSGGNVRRFDGRRRVLFLSEALTRSSRVFQLAHQIGAPVTRGAVCRDHRAGLAVDAGLGRARARRFGELLRRGGLDALRPLPGRRADNRYDIEILEHPLPGSFEQVCHRLTSLSRPQQAACRSTWCAWTSVATSRSASAGRGIRFARYSGACPRWNVHGAFMTPGQIRIQVSRMPDGATYFCIARTVRKAAAATACRRAGWRSGWAATSVMPRAGLLRRLRPRERGGGRSDRHDLPAVRAHGLSTARLSAAAPSAGGR